MMAIFETYAVKSSDPPGTIATDGTTIDISMAFNERPNKNKILRLRLSRP